eukprot:scaffold84691_cov22-Prasinocladus_malaysianus.AAC.1
MLLSYPISKFTKAFWRTGREYMYVITYALLLMSLMAINTAFLTSLEDKDGNSLSATDAFW